MPPSRIKAILFAVLVVVIWSTSWILLKSGIQGIPTLTLNGMRYTLAFLVMLPFLFLPAIKRHFARMTRRDWKDLVLLGIVFIALAQGTLALSLVFLPATTASLIVNCTPLFVAFFGIGFLDEKPQTWQWAGLGVNLFGIFLYFFPVQRQDGNPIGLIIAFICLMFNTAGALLSRRINRGGRMNAFIVSTVSIGVGGIIMLVAGLVFYGMPVIQWEGSGLLVWLAVVNTAVAFPLWNYSLQTLTAMESNIISNTMLIYVAVLAYLFIGEGLTPQQVLGLVLTAVGAVLVQIQKPKRNSAQNI